MVEMVVLLFLVSCYFSEVGVVGKTQGVDQDKGAISSILKDFWKPRHVSTIFLQSLSLASGHCGVLGHHLHILLV